MKKILISWGFTEKSDFRGGFQEKPKKQTIYSGEGLIPQCTLWCSLQNCQVG